MFGQTGEADEYIERHHFERNTEADHILAMQAAPSDKINIGVIGSGSRGTFVMTVFQKDPALTLTSPQQVRAEQLEKQAERGQTCLLYTMTPFS